MTPLGATTGLADALGDAHGAIETLAKEVRRLGERHSADQDLIHMSRTLGTKLDAAADSLAAEGERLGKSLERTDRWALTRLKVTAPQVLTGP